MRVREVQEEARRTRFAAAGITPETQRIIVRGAPAIVDTAPLDVLSPAAHRVRQSERTELALFHQSMLIFCVWV
jgi:hypothetical protein